MTAHEFLISKGVVSLKESYSVYGIQKWLEEYANIVLSVAAEKAETTIEETADDPYDHYIIVDKQSILNCLKD